MNQSVINSLRTHVAAINALTNRVETGILRNPSAYRVEQVSAKIDAACVELNAIATCSYNGAERVKCSSLIEGLRVIQSRL